MSSFRSGNGERKGPVDPRSNGTPARGLVDAAAAAELKRASELLADEGRERDVIDLCVPLLRTFEHNEDYDHLVDCLFTIGEACYHLGDWPNAEKYMSRAAELGYRYFKDEMSSYPLKVVGEAQFEQGQEEAALATFRERLHLLRRENDIEELGPALFDVGGMLVNTGHYDDAIAMLREAYRVLGTRRAELERELLGGGIPGEDFEDTDEGVPATEDDDLPEMIESLKVDEAETLYHVAIAHFRKDELEEAGVFLRRALERFGELSEERQEEVSDRIVAVLDDLVQVSETLEDFPSAELYRRKRDDLNL
jgi:tetratricopeptide (TPR) repeat protein